MLLAPSVVELADVSAPYLFDRTSCHSNRASDAVSPVVTTKQSGGGAPVRPTRCFHDDSRINRHFGFRPTIEQKVFAPPFESCLAAFDSSRGPTTTTDDGGSATTQDPEKRRPAVALAALRLAVLLRSKHAEALNTASATQVCCLRKQRMLASWCV
jgi:hypothetical protein